MALVAAIACTGGLAGAPVAEAAAVLRPQWSVMPLSSPITVAIKNPVGVCRRSNHIIYAPANRDQICRTGIMILGHALPKPKRSGYLQRVVAKLKAGRLATYQGRVYRVAWVRSIRKENLPVAVRATTGTDRYLITCDTRSGYRNHHAKNNLVVRLVLSRR